MIEVRKGDVVKYEICGCDISGHGLIIRIENYDSRIALITVADPNRAGFVKFGQRWVVELLCPRESVINFWSYL